MFHVSEHHSTVLHWVAWLRGFATTFPNRRTYCGQSEEDCEESAGEEGRQESAGEEGRQEGAGQEGRQEEGRRQEGPRQEEDHHQRSGGRLSNRLRQYFKSRTTP